MATVKTTFAGMRAQQIKWLPVLMAVTITGIAALQLYWLNKAYEREARTLEKTSNVTFRETVHELQAAKLNLNNLAAEGLATAPRRGGKRPGRGTPPDEKMANLLNVLREKLKDTGPDHADALAENRLPDTAVSYKLKSGRRARLMQFLYAVDSLQDTLRVTEICTVVKQRLEQQNITVPFVITRLTNSRENDPQYNEVTLGFAHPVTYHLALDNTAPYLIKRIVAPILLSLFIVGLTTLSFALLYRNLLRQRRLAEIKNEFISNITHELKTPIATVSVAIEALRSFNQNMDVEKSKEYLDISANELQRLSLLVDKVLKLSMFEKKEIDLKYEPLDVEALVAEVTASMRLQFEKYGAAVHVTSEGDTIVQGDRLHLVSVIFNLLDNALKYSTGAPKIDVAVQGNASGVTLQVTDNGIGIPAEYRDKIFDKFFRVPTGNVHNTKGYGLGLSYVAHVVRKHKGTITVEPTGGGSCFRISLPKNKA